MSYAPVPLTPGALTGFAAGPLSWLKLYWPRLLVVVVAKHVAAGVLQFDRDAGHAHAVDEAPD